MTHLDGRKLYITTKPGEVIKPQTGDDDAEWEVFQDTDCPECDDVAKCQLQSGMGADKLKDFTAFVIDKSSGHAHFKNDRRSDIIAGKRSTKATKGSTLYVIPDDAIASLGRMRKAVREEGLPTFKNSMQRGNLFINITIGFPEPPNQPKSSQPSSSNAARNQVEKVHFANEQVHLAERLHAEKNDYTTRQIRYGMDHSKTMNTADSLTDYREHLRQTSVVTGGNFAKFMDTHEGFVGYQERKAAKHDRRQYSVRDEHVLKGVF